MISFALSLRCFDMQFYFLHRPVVMAVSYTHLDVYKRQVKYYEVTFDQQSRAPKRVDLYFDLGEQVSYTIHKIQPKEHISSQSFTFAPQEYKSLEVVDLR